MQSDDADEPGAHSSDEDQPGEAPAAARRPDEQARDARCAQREEARAARNQAASLRQQSLQEVLVDREVERPDRAPEQRPRRGARWNRAEAWAAVAPSQG